MAFPFLVRTQKLSLPRFVPRDVYPSVFYVGCLALLQEKERIADIKLPFTRALLLAARILLLLLLLHAVAA